MEDNVVNEKIATKLLQKLGCSVDVARNGSEAVEMVERHAFDLVFMDCQMPVMDGFDATAAIRSGKAETSRVTIVAMTASSLAGDRERCLEAGMDDYLAKPITLDALSDVLRRWTRR